MKVSVGLWAFGSMNDRFAVNGYRRPFDLREVVTDLRDVQGIEFNLSPGFPVEDVISAAGEKGLKVSSVGVDLFSDPKWKYGAMSVDDKKLREQALDEVSRAAELAKEFGAVVNVWPGQDGFDYPFQVDYASSWERSVEFLAEAANREPNVKISLEYKPREPRVHEVPGNLGEALLMVVEANRNNLGITIDVGHSLMAGEGLAKAVSLAASKKKLFHLHLNDNFGQGDDDLIFGSVHRVDFIEMLYWTRKYNYEGWYSFDIFPYREDPFRAVSASSKALRTLYDKAASLEGLPSLSSGEVLTDLLGL